ncbi:hypothetical protein [Shimia sp. SDUM112013]|uniref:hypothetical protein n=1 Tax=Shimia sp. SDUM112013 TaxID=3136160 RepID=UPI0032EED8EE
MSMTETNPNFATTTPSEEAESHHDEAISRKGLAMLYAVLAAVVVAWGSAIFAYGIPGLYIPALCMVPVMYLILVIIAKG